jgi:hypothetical protein
VGPSSRLSMPSGRRGRAARWTVFGVVALMAIFLPGPIAGHATADAPPMGGHLARMPSALGAEAHRTGAGPSANPPDLPLATPVRIGHIDPSVRRPAGWPAGAPPPGAPVPPGTVFRPTPTPLGVIQPVWNNSVCAGLWPQVWGKLGGQGLYAPGCYGHDEPAVEFYSNLPGSGGNVTWNVTLPIDRSPTMEQADLYVAIWFGLTLSDPYSWLHQCFLELQFYPDSSYGSSPSYDHWVAAAVAWQLEATNGYENPCYYSPLYLEGSGSSTYFDMAGGDSLTVRFEGWAGDPAGENVTVSDLTSGNASTLDLFNATANLPLDPAFAQNDVDNSLLWTPGGEFPVSFAFETGHAAAGGFPENSSYGGCSQGVPPPTRQDPAVPCPSYDPGSWLNDSLAPWRISVPTFFNATATMRPAQVGFGQPEGGHLTIDAFSNQSCDGRDGSAWCSYPWYSYTCADHAFEFGATDYPGTSADFGKYFQFGYNGSTNGLGLYFYAPTNFSMPACGAPTYSLAVGADPGGVLNFLSERFPPNGTVSGLGAGWYSLSALPTAGLGFDGWTVQGAIELGTPSTDPWAAVDVLGNGSIAARFGPVRANATIAFSVPRPSGGPSALLEELTSASANPTPSANLTNGTSAALPVGVYWLEAHAPAGQTFSAWQAGPGLVLVSSRSPFTWLIVTGTEATTNLSATFAASSASANVYGYVSGSRGGRLAFDKMSTTSSTEASLAAGTWRFQATPDPGYVFAGWYVGGDGESDDVGPIANVTVEGASVYVYAYFRDALTIAVANGTPGAVEVGGYGRYTEGSVLDLTAGTYAVASLPAPGRTFRSWSSSNASALWVESPTSPSSDIVVNASATLTVRFAQAASSRLAFAMDPSDAGTIQFDDGPLEGAGATNTTLSAGTFPIAAVANPGYAFSGWSTNGSLSVGNGTTGSELVVSGNGGTLTADFSAYRVPVTFAASGLIGAVGTINGTRLTEDETLLLFPGVYPVSVNVTGPDATFTGWQTTEGLSVSGGNLTVANTGTIYALVAPFGISAPTATPLKVRLDGALTLSVAVHGTGPFAYAWQGLPGCAGATATLSCRPTVTGTFHPSVVIADPLGDSAVSPAVAVAVDDRALAAATRVSPNATDVGQIVRLSVSVENGFAPYAYRYTGLPAGCVSFDVPSISCLAAAAPDLAVTVTDAIGLNATFPLALVVNPLPTLAISTPAAWSIDQGVTTTLAVTLRGGTAPFTLDWSGLPPGCPAVNRTSLACTPTANGTYVVTATVTDAVGATATAQDTFFAYPGPAIALSAPSVLRTDVGVPVTLSVVPSGGFEPYTIHYAGLPSSCPDENATTLNCTPSVAGTFAYTVTISDRDGLSGSTNGTLNVSADPTIAAFTLSPPTVTVGTDVVIVTDVSGGLPRFAYRYSGLPGCPSVDAASFACLPASAGHYKIEVNATDALGESAIAFANLTVRPHPAAPGVSVFATGLGIAAIGIGAVAAVFLWRRRRARATSGPPPRPPVRP